MIRSVLLACALAAVVAGGASAALARLADETERTPAATQRPKPKPKKPKSTAAIVVVTVVNGDTHRRVAKARVSIGRHSAVTNAHGEAQIRLARRAPLLVAVEAKGYTAKEVRMPFQRRRKVTVKVYRPALQWTMYGRDHKRSQAQTDIQLRPPFRVVWSRGVGSLVEFPAVVSDGVAFVANLKGQVLALEMTTGRVVWRYLPGARGKMASSPAVVGEDVIVHGMDGIVRVLDRRNGKLRWQLDVGSPIESSPVVRYGVDYFGAWNGNVYALDLTTREMRWVHRSGAKVTSSAALNGKVLYIGNYAGRLLALTARTGALRWSRAVNGRVYGTPAVAGNKVFVPSSTGGSLTAFTTAGRQVWRVNTGSYVYSSPAVWANRVYFGSYNGRLYSVAAGTGKVLWTVPVGGRISGAAVVVDGVAYAGTRKRIVGADGKSGKVLMRFPHGDYVPVSGNGRFLLLHGFSRIWAVEPVKRAR